MRSPNSRIFDLNCNFLLAGHSTVIRRCVLVYTLWVPSLSPPLRGERSGTKGIRTEPQIGTAKPAEGARTGHALLLEACYSPVVYTNPTGLFRLCPHLHKNNLPHNLPRSQVREATSWQKVKGNTLLRKRKILILFPIGSAPHYSYCTQRLSKPILLYVSRCQRSE